MPDGGEPGRPIERAGRDADVRPLNPLPEHRGATGPAEATSDAGRRAVPAQARVLDQLEGRLGRCGVGSNVTVRAPALATVAVDHGLQGACHPVAYATTETSARTDLIHHRCPPKRFDLITGQLVLR